MLALFGDILVDGTPGLEVHLSQCCSPIAGEPIIGVVTRAKGISIHTKDCSNIKRVNKDRIIDVAWIKESKSSYTVELEVDAIDRQGLLKDILAKISDSKTNLSNVNATSLKDKTARINLVVDVSNLSHLKKLINTIKQMSDVSDVFRLKRHSKSFKHSIQRSKKKSKKGKKRR